MALTTVPPEGLAPGAKLDRALRKALEAAKEIMVCGMEAEDMAICRQGQMIALAVNCGVPAQDEDQGVAS